LGPRLAEGETLAAVIRDARIDPEPMLLAVIARPKPSRAASSAAAGAVGSSVPAPALAAVSVAHPRPHDGPLWTQSVGDVAVSALNPNASPAEEEEAFRERLEVERLEVLAEAEVQGFEAGLQRGAAAYTEQIDELANVVASARSALESGIAGTEDVMVEIAFEAVCKILGDAVGDSAGVVAVVREILRTVHERERLVVRVSPAQHEILLQHRGQLLKGEDGMTIDFVADERVTLGGCLVETTGGTLDGRLETQLQRLIDTLTSARRMQGEGMP
jgi:flagellar assembly protein FliH